MRILFIAYVDLDKGTSGSSVRPAKMLKAFQDEGHEMIVLSGVQTGKDRIRRIRDVLREIKESKPDLCYIESPTYPIMRHADRKLIKIIHEMGVPIGYFYRDFYRKFPKEFPRRKTISGKIKDVGLDYLQFLTDCCLNNCDIIYVPSDEAAKLLEYKDIRPLPPAGENHLCLRKEFSKSAIYVGGIGKAYNIGLLLDTFEQLNNGTNTYTLILVCRKAEWDAFKHSCKEAAWLKVHHASGKQLDALYAKASIAISIKASTPYNDFSISVKTFEYLGYGLPQIVNNGKAITELIEREKIGLSVEPTVETFASAVKLLLNNPRMYASFQNSIQESLLERNLWIHRVRQVVSELLPE